MERLLIALCALVVIAGCQLPHQARLDEGSIITHRRLIERPYKELGLVHAEVWGPTLYWRTSAADLSRAVNKALVKEAKKHGADAIVDIEVRVENHYSGIIFILIFGWEECHATGTAIKFTE
jgi:uncharacterized protein YbjQ (UPF0145 family)